MSNSDQKYEGKIYEYEDDSIKVTWDQIRCIHFENCVRHEPEVFDPDRRPWIEPEKRDAESVAEAVRTCPTGALHHERKDGGPAEEPEKRNWGWISGDGPFYLRGDIEIVDAEGNRIVRDTRIALCRCGESKAKPFCDGTHSDVGFKAPGKLPEGFSVGGDFEEGRKLLLRVRPNGPLIIEGPLEIRGQGEESGPAGSKGALCRCGASGNKPFCDGSHKEIGFEG